MTTHTMTLTKDTGDSQNFVCQEKECGHWIVVYWKNGKPHPIVLFQGEHVPHSWFTTEATTKEV